MAFLSPDELSAVRLSVEVALTAVATSLPFGVALGWLLARRDFPGKAAVETLVNLPLVLPPVVTGYLLLVAFGTRGALGRFLKDTFDLTFVFSWKGAALASAVMAFPLMVRAMRIAFAGVDHRLEDAARTLGAGPLDTFFTITLPLARHGVIAGAVLAFARSMGEFGATIMIAGNIPDETRTVPVYIYNLLNEPGGAESSTRLIAVSVTIASLALVLGEVLERRGRGRGRARVA
jgi:molybdate transport system permease protein